VTPPGLSSAQARQRLAQHGPNRLQAAQHPSLARRFVQRLANPLLLVLLAASLIAALSGDAASFAVVLVVVLMSVTLDLVQEQRADRSVEALQQSVALKVRVWRDGRCIEVPAAELVPGDCIELAAGALVPADGQVVAATDCFVNQALLTGEAFPVEKRAGADEEAGSLQSPTTVFMGSAVVSGSARVVVLATGARTQLGQLAGSLQQAPPPTAFERGTRHFGLLLTRWTMGLVLAVLLINTLYHRPLLESFLFAVALAVGLTPELLPMIVSVTLARGAMRLARQGVIVKRLSAIEDLGAMDVLCTDKTGTLTEAALTVERSIDGRGETSDAVFELAWLNSRFETGVKAALDAAILAHRTLDDTAWRKLDEVPFDFERKRVSVLLQREAAGRLLVIKGAPEEIVRLCVAWDDGEHTVPMDEAARAGINRLFDDCSAQGLRLLAVARRSVDNHTVDVSATDEHDFSFAGFIAFADPPKASAAAALHELRARGVAHKIITGDNEAVTRHLCAQLGVPVEGVVDGREIGRLDDHGLQAAVARANLFCRVTPEQKSRIVRACQAGGHVVGYLGDGANDAPPLHAADIGISVDGAVDVAQQAADLVLLKHDLAVLQDGVREGRRTVLNVEKYILMATSSNFGNMVSMAVAALFLPFLPMRPLQILLNNLLYDVSELALPMDRVEEARLMQPQPWNIDAIRRFMLRFGPLSSLFDLAAFGVLIGVFKASEATFQTAWFVESMATQVLVVFIIRTPGPAWRHRASPWVAAASIGVALLALALPYTPLGPVFGLVPLPVSVMAAMASLTACYLAAAEVMKRTLHRSTRQAVVPAG
jgi:Mg2+-importing ATPase